MRIQNLQNNYDIFNKNNSPAFQKLIIKDAKKFPTEILDETVHNKAILGLTDYFSPDKVDVTVKYVKHDGEYFVETYAGMNGYCDVLEFSNNIKEYQCYNSEINYDRYNKSADKQTRKMRKKQFNDVLNFVKSFNKGLKS